MVRKGRKEKTKWEIARDGRISSVSVAIWNYLTYIKLKLFSKLSNMLLQAHMVARRPIAKAYRLSRGEVSLPQMIDKTPLYQPSDSPYPKQINLVVYWST